MARAWKRLLEVAEHADFIWGWGWKTFLALGGGALLTAILRALEVVRGLWLVAVGLLSAALIFLIMHELHQRFPSKSTKRPEIAPVIAQPASEMDTIAPHSVTSTNWQQEWREMEAQFRKLDSRIFAECAPDEQGEHWAIKAEIQNFDPFAFKALCQLAGSRLRSSSPPIPLSATTASRQEDWERWLYFVRETRGYTTEQHYHRRKNIYYGGLIENLGKQSADVCVECRSTTYI